MTQKELISKIKGLKDIKPDREWVILSKNNVIKNEKEAVRPERNSLMISGFLKNAFNLLMNRRIAYAFAAFLFVLMGVVGLTGNINLNEGKDTASLLIAQNAINKDIELLKIKSQNLAEIVKADQVESIDLAVKEVEEITKGLTVKLKNNPRLTRDAALNLNKNKTYLEIIGSDVAVSERLKETSSVLYKTITEQMIQDLEKATLSEKQQESLDEIKGAYKGGLYSKALESILLLNDEIEDVDENEETDKDIKEDLQDNNEDNEIEEEEEGEEGIYLE